MNTFFFILYKCLTTFFYTIFASLTIASNTSYCMFDSISKGSKIDSGGVELILTYLVAVK